MTSRSKTILGPFDEYQKARVTFVQKIADLAHRPQNIVALHASGVMPLLRPLLLDSVQVIQQTAALAIGRLANFSKEIAESVIQNDIITQLIYSLSNQNKYYKKAACYVLRAVAKHTEQLAEDVVKCGALDPLIQNLSDFDIGVKETAAWALGYIAKHSSNLAEQIVLAKGISPLINCLKDTDISLNRAAASTLINICKHSEELASSIPEEELTTISNFLTNKDVQIKRSVCLLLAYIAKHSNPLAKSVWDSIGRQAGDIKGDKRILLACLLDSDLSIKQNAAICISEIVNKGNSFSEELANEGGIYLLKLFVSNTKNEEAKLPGLVALGNIASYNEKLAECIIRNNLIEELKEILLTSNEQSLLSLTCFVLGEIGKHTHRHAEEILNKDILKYVLDLYNNSINIDMKKKSYNALKAVIENCDNMSYLQPLLKDIKYDDEKIFQILTKRMYKLLNSGKGANNKKDFISSKEDGLRKLLELKMHRKANLSENELDNDEVIKSINKIADLYDQHIRTNFDPEFENEIRKRINDIN